MAEPRKLHALLLPDPSPGMRDIGRRTIYGNPYDAAGNPLGGETIGPFKQYLWKRLNNEPMFRQQLMALVQSSDKLWCPGCGPRGRTASAALSRRHHHRRPRIPPQQSDLQVR
jgi:hypothetical protein